MQFCLKRLIYICLCLVSVHTLAYSKTISENTNDQDIINAKNKVYPALVRIYVTMETPGPNGRVIRRQSAGSGAVISSKGYVVTNHHVAGEASRIIVNFSNQDEVAAELVGTDALTDIAVLKIDPDKLKSPDISVAEWGDSDAVQSGDVVFALGSPGALSQSITKGIIANVNGILPKRSGSPLQLSGEDVGSMVTWFFHDAQIFGGNSGGPLVDTQGKIIGINEIGISGLSGAIPSNIARHSTNQIIQYGRVPRSDVGITFRPLLKELTGNNQGVLIEHIMQNSPAAKAKLKPGDIITHINNQTVHAKILEHIPGINRLIAQLPIGGKATIRYLRNNKKKKTSLKTVERQPNLPQSHEFKQLGLLANNLSPTLASDLKRKNENGVLVFSLQEGKPLTLAKPRLIRRDIITKINDTPINNIDDLKSFLEKINNKKVSNKVIITFERNHQNIISFAKIEKVDKLKPIPSVKKAWLPIETQAINPNIASQMGLKNKFGVRVIAINNQKKFPLRIGDIITGIDGQPVKVTRPEEKRLFNELIRSYPINTKVDFDIVRKGKEKKIKVTLMDPPKTAEFLPEYEDEAFEFTVRELAFSDMNNTKKGLIIKETVPGGIANFNGLRQNDILISINGTEVNDVDTFKNIMNKLHNDASQDIVFFIKRQSRNKYVEIEFK